MLYDLKGENSMSPIVGMLHSAVIENNQRLWLITDGMSQEELDYKGNNHRFNSTAQLIKHLMVVDLNWACRIKGEPLSVSLKERYGPMIDQNNELPMVKEVCLKSLMSNYDDVLAMLKDACLSLTDDDLVKVVTFGHNNEKQATLRWGLWHIADHCRYHQAHINQLRKWYREA
ncbi:DinB family protein [Paenibacillus sp. 1001270B_150601_E10]|uniref:DinB family protein n=1 Tax=Paenibacillus sp. 1001270B_150601_E10 TaxID=2787079 RepID=UPI00189CCFB6|nr:DinB family protein [Paenibacillus sp. 1001270B_150601_E10]